MMLSILVPTILVLSVSGLSAQTTWYVPDDFPTIQGAILDASVVNGDTIVVRPGTYKENVDFFGKIVTLTSEEGADVTFINGKQNGSVVVCRSGEDGNTVLNGFTLYNGTGTPTHVGYFGGGMYNWQSSPTVSNCKFVYNSPDSFGNGGGMYNDFLSAPLVIDCRFGQNEAGIGGGMYNAVSSDPIVYNCIFSNNTALFYGGGMINEGCSPTVSFCNFSKNSSAGEGGGIANRFSGAPTLKSCTFSQNEAVKGGGMFNFISSPLVTECFFEGNTADEVGGAIYNWNDSNPTMSNCTSVGNTAGNFGGGIYCELNCATVVSNCIFWNDTPEEIYNDGSSTSTVGYSCVEGGYIGDGNIDSDPLFADSVKKDFHLRYTSPCRDAGDNSAVVEPDDFEGDPRIAHGTVDMGADEFYTHLYVKGNTSPGGSITGKLVGVPGTAPVYLFIGFDVRAMPLTTVYGDFYLLTPWLLIPLVPIPAHGILELPTTIPSSPSAPYDLPMQGLIGLSSDSLTNLYVMEVR